MVLAAWPSLQSNQTCYSKSNDLERFWWKQTMCVTSRCQQPAHFGTQKEVFLCYAGDNRELFTAELESLELDFPEMHPSTGEEIWFCLTVRCLSSVSVWRMAGHLTNPMFQHRPGMNRYIILFCASPIRSSYSCNYSLLCCDNSTKGTRVVRVRSVAPICVKWYIGPECDHESSWKCQSFCVW